MRLPAIRDLTGRLVAESFVERSVTPAQGAAEPAVRPLDVALDPELLFLVALAGEEPIDLVQRRMLDAPLHPLLERILRIHVRDESRHLAFARAFLRRTVPRLPDSRRREVRYTLPYLARRITDRMVLPGAGLGRTFGLSPEALAAESATGAFADLRGAATRRLFGLASELGLVTERTAVVWRRLGVAVEP